MTLREVPVVLIIEGSAEEQMFVTPETFSISEENVNFRSHLFFRIVKIRKLSGYFNFLEATTLKTGLRMRSLVFKSDSSYKPWNGLKVGIGIEDVLARMVFVLVLLRYS